MIRAAIVDTNVVVAGLLTGRTDSPVARVLDGMLLAAFPFVVSDALLAQYHEVLLRPELSKAHGLSGPETETLLLDIARHAIVLRAAPSGVAAPDAGDQHLWDLLGARDDLVLVTGDKRLLRDPAMHERVLVPSAFLQAQRSG